MAAMVEFAGIMMLQRKNRFTTGKKVTVNGQLARRGSFEMDELTTKIDMMALILFPLTYIVFNVAHWAGHII